MPGVGVDSLQESIDSLHRRVPVGREEWDKLNHVERQNAFTVSRVTEGRVLQDVLDKLGSAVEDGTTLEDFKDEIAAELIEAWGGEIPGRLENIFRTNVLSSYAEGRYAVHNNRAVREARPYWRFDDSGNDRECEECNECGGTILPADDPWWATHTPLLHFQCACIITALSAEEAGEEGVDEEGPDVETDEDFGEPPSGEPWEPDLSWFDPELREAIEAALAGGG